jgi:hypothetical protein
MSEREKRNLEGLMDALARGQPLRRAPSSLEQRVLAQLAARSAAPWWKKGFAHWPLAAQGAFLIASIGFVKLAISGFVSVTSFVGSEQVAGPAVSLVRQGTEAASVTASAGYFLLHAIPPAWLYGAATAGFILYALLFGLGAFAYRTLYVQR